MPAWQEVEVVLRLCFFAVEIRLFHVHRVLNVQHPTEILDLVVLLDATIGNPEIHVKLQGLMQ